MHHTVAVRETFPRRIAEYRPNVNNNPHAVGGQRTSSIGAADETDKLVHVTRGIVGVFRATAMPEVAVPFSFRRATARAVHPADLIAIYRWRPAGQAGAL